jgi:hypothetical protein
MAAIPTRKPQEDAEVTQKKFAALCVKLFHKLVTEEMHEM